MLFDSWAFQTSTFESCLWKVPVMSYWYWRRRHFNTSPRFRYQSYSSSMPTLLFPHIHGVVCPSSRWERRCWEGSTGIREDSVLSVAHTADGLTTTSELPLLGHNMLNPNCPCSWAITAQRTSQERPQAFNRCWFYEHLDSILMATFLIKWQCRARGVAIFMPWQLISLGRLLGLLCFHYMNQKYISVRLHHRRESTVYRKFTLADVYGAQKWCWCDLSIPSTTQKKSTYCRQGEETAAGHSAACVWSVFTVNERSVHALLSRPHPYWEDLLNERLHITILQPFQNPLLNDMVYVSRLDL